MKKQIISAVNRAIDTVLPPRCVLSGEIVGMQGAIHPEVWQKLNFISAPVCDQCGIPFIFHMEAGAKCADCLSNTPLYAQARAALVYDEVSRDLILKFKHADQMHAVISFIPWMMRAGYNQIRHSDLIIPVPLNRWRLLKRKYNQAAVIAAMLAKKESINWSPFILQRIRATPSQGHLKPSQRAENVKGAFAIPAPYEDKVRGKSVLLVDDVLTTGATVNECTKTLLKSGAKEVSILTLARVVKAS